MKPYTAAKLLSQRRAQIAREQFEHADEAPWLLILFNSIVIACTGYWVCKVFSAMAGW